LGRLQQSGERIFEIRGKGIPTKRGQGEKKKKGMGKTGNAP
jgi:hypothetical protein